MADKQALIDGLASSDRFALDRHSAFMKDIAPHLVGGFFSAMFTVYFFYDVSSTTQHAIWVIGHVLMGGFFAVIYGFYFKKPDVFTLKQWEVVSYGMVFLLSIYWSLPAFLFLNTENYLYAVVLMLQLLTVCVAPAPAVVFYPKAYYLFVSLPFIAVFIFLVFSGADYAFFIYVMPIACWLTLVLYGLKLKDNVFKTLSLQVENALAWQSAKQADIAKSKFLAAASHDIRQPLQAISLLLEAFDESQQREKERQLLQHLKYSVSGMSELLNSLLEISRLDAQVINIVPEHIALKPLCEKLLQELDQQKQNEAVTLHLQCANLIALADPIILKRILRNLLSNALRYTPSGSITLSAAQQAENIIISVIDTGVGIEESEQSQIFNEFHQVAEQGSKGNKGLGLGLSIVKRLCELHDWKIELNSTAGKGSVFSLAIAIGDIDQVNGDVTLPSITQLHGVSIVIVDDDRGVLEALQSLLEKWGASVATYDNPDTALIDLRQQNIAMPDLIISDYRLGNNNNGIAFIQAVHIGIDANIQAILITGDTGIKEIQDTSISGSTVLHKPIKPSQLRKLIQLKLKHLF